MLCAVGTCAKGKIAILGPIKNRLLFVYKLAIWTGSISLRQKMYRGAVSLKGFQSMGNGRNSIKNRSQLFNDDLSNDRAFDQIDLHGQYLYATLGNFMKNVCY